MNTQNSIEEPKGGVKGSSSRGRSRIGAPLEPSTELEAEVLGLEARDLAEPAPLVPELSPDSSALESMLPRGLTLRALGSRLGDREALFKHWMSLGPEGQRLRFFHNPSESLLRGRVFKLDFIIPRFAGIFDSHGALVCVAEWALDSGEGPGQAESAFSTLHDYRRLGLAKIAAAACAMDARAHGVKLLRIDTLLENRPAQALASSLGGTRQISHSDGSSYSVSSHIDLSAQGALSIEGRLGLLGIENLQNDAVECA